MQQRSSPCVNQHWWKTNLTFFKSLKRNLMGWTMCSWSVWINQCFQQSWGCQSPGREGAGTCAFRAAAMSPQSWSQQEISSASSAGKPAPCTAHPGLTKDALASLTDHVLGFRWATPRRREHTQIPSATHQLCKVQLQNCSLDKSSNVQKEQTHYCSCWRQAVLTIRQVQEMTGLGDP